MAAAEGELVDDPIRRTFGRYELVSRIAVGGMGEVWLSRVKGVRGFEKTVVLKTMLPHIAEQQDFVDMFVREASLAARLNHPNVVQTLDLGQIDGQLYIAMEYVPGRTMRQIARAAKRRGELLPAWFVARVTAGVCEGLQYAHDFCDDEGEPLGIIHRDVSPENVIVSFNGIAKLLDFGLAKLTAGHRATLSTSLKGKYPYMSPEQIRGDALDRRTDVYSLGTVLYELTSGVRPFRERGELALLTEVLRGKPTPPRKFARWIPPAVADITLKSMAADRDKRFASGADLSDALERWMGTQQRRGSRDVALFVSSLFDTAKEIPHELRKSLAGYRRPGSPPLPPWLRKSKSGDKQGGGAEPGPPDVDVQGADSPPDGAADEGGGTQVVGAASSDEPVSESTGASAGSGLSGDRPSAPQSTPEHTLPAAGAGAAATAQPRKVSVKKAGGVISAKGTAKVSRSSEKPAVTKKGLVSSPAGKATRRPGALERAKTGEPPPVSDKSPSSRAGLPSAGLPSRGGRPTLGAKKPAATKGSKKAVAGSGKAPKSDRQAPSSEEKATKTRPSALAGKPGRRPKVDDSAGESVGAISGLSKKPTARPAGATERIPESTAVSADSQQPGAANTLRPGEGGGSAKKEVATTTSKDAPGINPPSSRDIFSLHEEQAASHKGAGGSIFDSAKRSKQDSGDDGYSIASVSFDTVAGVTSSTDEPSERSDLFSRFSQNQPSAVKAPVSSSGAIARKGSLFERLVDSVDRPAEETEDAAGPPAASAIEPKTSREARAHFDRGLRLAREGRFDAALDEWEEALKLDPDNRTYRANLRRVRDRLEKNRDRGGEWFSAAHSSDEEKRKP